MARALRQQKRRARSAARTATNPETEPLPPMIVQYFGRSSSVTISDELTITLRNERSYDSDTPRTLRLELMIEAEGDAGAAQPIVTLRRFDSSLDESSRLSDVSFALPAGLLDEVAGWIGGLFREAQAECRRRQAEPGHTAP